MIRRGMPWRHGAGEGEFGHHRLAVQFHPILLRCADQRRRIFGRLHHLASLSVGGFHHHALRPARSDGFDLLHPRSVGILREGRPRHLARCLRPLMDRSTNGLRIADVDGHSFRRTDRRAVGHGLDRRGFLHSMPSNVGGFSRQRCGVGREVPIGCCSTADALVARRYQVRGTARFTAGRNYIEHIETWHATVILCAGRRLLDNGSVPINIERWVGAFFNHLCLFAITGPWHAQIREIKSTFSSSTDAVPQRHNDLCGERSNARSLPRQPITRICDPGKCFLSVTKHHTRWDAYLVKTANTKNCTAEDLRENHCTALCSGRTFCNTIHQCN
mmetsp:Transcript_22219/g.63753  ORF Transcript_22219/g.63753 Transcript_22219/m.63753 type:complete len:331 (+) Transcript_22219:537-1529(+)